MAKTIIMKPCRICKQEKPISEFRKRSDSKDGHRNECKNCRRESDNTYHRSEKGQASAKRYVKSLTRKRYLQSKKSKLAVKHYQQSEKGKIVSRRAVAKYQRRFPERRKAGNTVNNAIIAGRIARPDSLKCSCGEQARHYHHSSYASKHFLDIIPLCLKCHSELRLTS